jgi:hypothetical protein
MFIRSWSSVGLALLSAVAITAPTLPAAAKSAAYCRDHVRYAPDRGEFNPALIIPLAVLGGGIGAGVGAVAGGLSIATGAAVGAGTGAGIGAVKGVYHTRGGFERAYEECRAR